MLCGTAGEKKTTVGRPFHGSGRRCGEQADYVGTQGRWKHRGAGCNWIVVSGLTQGRNSNSEVVGRDQHLPSSVHEQLK